jgi:hypothetical protein
MVYCFIYQVFVLYMGFIWIGCNLALVSILNCLLSSPNSSFWMHVWKICRWFGRWIAWLGDGQTYLGWEKFGFDSIPSFNYGNQQNLSHQLYSWYSTVLFGSVWKPDRYYGSNNAFSHVFVSAFFVKRPWKIIRFVINLVMMSSWMLRFFKQMPIL